MPSIINRVIKDFDEDSDGDLPEVAPNGAEDSPVEVKSKDEDEPANGSTDAATTKP